MRPRLRHPRAPGDRPPRGLGARDGSRRRARGPAVPRDATRVAETFARLDDAEKRQLASCATSSRRDAGARPRPSAFELVDDDGHVRARLAPGEDGAVALDLAGTDGTVRLTIGLAPDGSAIVAGLRDGDGTVRALLTAPPRAAGSPSLDLIDAEGRQRVSVMEGEGLPAGVAIWDGSGHHRAVLAHGPEPDRDASIEFWDAEGRYRTGFGTWPDGSTGVELLDDRGNVRGRLGELARTARSASSSGTPTASCALGSATVPTARSPSTSGTATAPTAKGWARSQRGSSVGSGASG